MIVQMIQQLQPLSYHFNYNKGIFYLPGVGLGSLVLIFVIIYESVLRKPLTQKIASRCTRIAIGSVVVIFVLPQLVGYGVDEYFSRIEYQVCDEVSHQWLHSQTIVYARDQSVCVELAAKNNI